jgi:hypothetical protein
MTTPAPHATRRLPAVDPNMAKALGIVTLGQATFGILGLYFESCVAESRDIEGILVLPVSYQSDKEEGKGYKGDSSFRRRTLRLHVLDADDFVALLLEGHYNVFRRGVIVQVPYNSFYRLGSFGVVSEEWETLLI